MEGLLRLLDVLATPLGWLGVVDWQHPSQSLIVNLIYAGIGAVVLTNKVSGARAVTAPVSFFVLFACATTANRLFHGYRFAGSSDLQHTLIYTMVGTVFGSLLVLLVLRSASRGEN
jgi:hypothetical protein